MKISWRYNTSQLTCESILYNLVMLINLQKLNIKTTFKWRCSEQYLNVSEEEYASKNNLFKGIMTENCLAFLNFLNKFKK